MEIVTMPPPSGGGVMLLETFGSFSRAELAQMSPERADTVHTLAELFRGAIADRFRAVGDPDRTPVDAAPLLASARLAARRASIRPRETRPPSAFSAAEDHGTSHVVVVDGEGNVASVTSTVNNPFGSKLVAEGPGILLNDELDDFTRRTAGNVLGLKDPPGAGKPGARPPSSMCPTIVLHGDEPVLALGGSGGMRIATSVTLVALAILGRGMAPSPAVRAPRFHVRFDGALVLEKDGLPPAERADLASRGESLVEEENLSAVQVISRERRGSDVVLEPAADPRKFGLAEAR
jgi:gamma-glutamyltranspeptidase / glutathione hydrolase